MALPEFLEPPAQGSALAGRVDMLFGAASLVAAIASAFIACLLLYLGLKYRRKNEAHIGQEQVAAAPPVLEVVWTVIPLGVMLFFFAWGADVFFEQNRPPADADEYFVVGRQWMWKVQHPSGPREINELHAPVGRAIKLTMTSEDVIHSFYVPAFRIKADVLPDRYTTTWFRATRPGVYHLFCAEYCGTVHSGMGGKIIILEPDAYEDWLAHGNAGQQRSASGEEIFNSRGCGTCHRPDSDARAPILTGVAGREVKLASGDTVKADDTYLRESIVRPAAKVVAGYSPIMPAYEGQISEEEIGQLLVYLRSLAPPEGGTKQ
ncbi:MAG: cytochrome c oxidase subunit II [Polyangiaceae bacterium]